MPSEIARRLKIESGIKLEWKVQPDQTILMKRQLNREEIVGQLEGLGRDRKLADSDPTGDLIRDRLQDDIDNNLW